MGRPRASDHAEKRAALLRAAARLFADHGYDRTSLARIAEECGVSKALFYHYYRDKVTLLGDIVREHLVALDRSLAEADDPGRPPEDRLRVLVEVLLANYRDADAEHQVQVAHLRLLPDEVQEELRELERSLVRRFAGVVGLLAPGLAEDRALRMPLTMSLFGMVNWMFLWWREDGPLTREAYAAMVAALIASGARELKARESGLRRAGGSPHASSTADAALLDSASPRPAALRRGRR